ncbi:MAG: FAD-binding protein [Actinobacteria bacterium]|nr:FAD-binding protein [Actinomycetota bacterium]
MRPTINALEKDLRRLIRGDVEFDPISRHLYATDGSIFQIEPLGVVSPRDADDVARLVAYASQHSVPLVARGAGSGLAGAALGTGLQVDFTRYMNRILEFAPDGSWVRVEPGVIMGELNRRAKSYGTFFAPNPSSENYCSLGGMIGCNSSGSRSVAYGGTKDHVLALNIVLHDGRTFEAGTLGRDSAELAQLLQGDSLPARAFRNLVTTLEEQASIIEASLPRVMKNASGYRVETVLEPESGLVHLHKIFVGAEGTLGLVTEATLNLVPLPGKRAIAMAYFPTVFSAGETVFPILGLKPTSLEIMDAGFLRFVRRNDPKIDALVPANADTALLVEFEAADDSQLAEQLESLQSLLAGGDAMEIRPAFDAAEQKQLWAVRQAAVPLLQKLPGPKRITEFIEDVTVHPDVLAKYMNKLTRILAGFGSEAIMYGHAGDGNIHTRPVLDLKQSSDLAIMQKMMDEVMDYALEIQGTPSGEHGDGLIRSPYVRRVYGDDVYNIFKSIKRTFDPNDIFNPGKKIVYESEGGGVGRNLRYGPAYWTFDQPTYLLFPDGEYEREIEKCHGCGQCKSAVGTSMCPIFKATRREHASPRAKANLLRNIIQGKLHPYDTYAEEAFKNVIDYCIECGMCAVECPSNVNIPKLMLEAKSKYRSLAKPNNVERVLGNAGLVFEAGHILAPVANAVMKQQPLRGIGERVVGIDRRRALPNFAGRTLSQRLRRRGKDMVKGSATTPGDYSAHVAFFYEMYANYNDPDLAFIMEELLRSHGVDVVFPHQKSSGILDMAYGLPAKASEIARYNVNTVLPYVRADAILVSGEPTATFAFRAHYADYLDDPVVAEVSAATRDLGEFLYEWRSAHPEQAPAPVAMPLTLAYHMPCHLKAQCLSYTFYDLVAQVPDVQLVDLDAGCCGMAGTFGTKAGTFELSMLAGRPVFDRVETLKPDLVLSDCSSCRMQIEQATGVATMHPAELLAHLYGITPARRSLP